MKSPAYLPVPPFDCQTVADLAGSRHSTSIRRQRWQPQACPCNHFRSPSRADRLASSASKKFLPRWRPILLCLQH
ncbi:unnamed protein product [Closterium sp. NIES-64]|nr:unnamed protein product [Closterium sp. NIES-64]